MGNTTKWRVERDMDTLKMEVNGTVVVHTCYGRCYKGKAFWITLYPNDLWTLETLNSFQEIDDVKSGFKTLKEAKNWFELHTMELSEKYGLEG